MFPHDREVPNDLFRELSGILLHLGIDYMTSPNSTAVYSELELNKLLGYVGYIKQVGGKHGFSACVVGRLMNFFIISLYINFYGQKGARLTSDQTICGLQPRRTYLIKTLSIFFFNAPMSYIRGLESVYTDFIISRSRWVEFVTRLQSDWAEFVLYATVFLTASVSFLAIPSVDPGNRTRTPVQLASYLSVLTSLGSIVTGLLLLRRYSTRPDDSAEDVNKYLQSRHNAALGFETLALLYSLPYSLLLWSTISFFVAFGLETLVFNDELWTKFPVGIVLVMAVLLIFWCVWIVWQARKDFSLMGRVHDLKDGLVSFTRGLRGKTSEPGSDAGDGGSVTLTKPGALKEAFSRLRRPRGAEASTSFVSVDQIGRNRCGPPDATAMEMGELGNKEPRSVV